ERHRALGVRQLQPALRQLHERAGLDGGGEQAPLEGRLVGLDRRALGAAPPRRPPRQRRPRRLTPRLSAPATSMNRLILLLLATLGLAPAAAQVPTVINVEIDYMGPVITGGHSHRPSQAEIDAVVQMFACRGITLNVVIDDEIAHQYVMRRDPDNANNFFNY